MKIIKRLTVREKLGLINKVTVVYVLIPRTLIGTLIRRDDLKF